MNTLSGISDLERQFVNGEFGETTPIEEPTETITEEATPVEVSESVEQVSEDTSAETEAPVETESVKEDAVDFASKDFAETQKVINMNARMNNLRREIDSVKKQKSSLADTSFKNPQTVSFGDSTINSSEDVIQYHLDRFTFDELQKYIGGDLFSKTTQERIDEFFENPETHEVLELSAEPNITDTRSQYDFKRGMLLYFKQNDEYLKKIDEELEKLNEATAELEENVSSVLNPLKDNVLAYSQYLYDQSEITEEDTDPEVIKKKKANRRKAIAVRSGFTLENMIQLVENNPSIVRNALRDFHNETKLQEIGKRYSAKLHTAKIDFNLFSLLSDDPKDSLEYRVLPQDDYPAGLEGFTVFFIIRSLAITLPSMDSVTFHASVQVAFTQLINGKCDPDIAETMKEAIKTFLAHFA
jgi:hypothetical protein